MILQHTEERRSNGGGGVVLGFFFFFEGFCRDEFYANIMM